jgi:nanoRNase/pAp phosphatase (c-di-AMP/oligoRNAs hydrolase)
LGIKNISYTPVNKSSNFRQDFIKWLSNNNVEDYDKIYILDLDVNQNKDIIDRHNFVIIDHHDSHEQNGKYEKARAIVKGNYKSAAELIYKAFKKIDPNINMTDAQKKLILYASDYDSYTLQLPESTKLNIVFNKTSNNFDSFIKSFETGYHGLTLQQENMVKIYNSEVEHLKEISNIFTGKFNIQSKERKIFAIFADNYINEMADFLLNEYKADISIVVNTKNDRVSFRRNKELEDIDLTILAGKLCEGGGHKYAAGGKITDDFMTFAKLLQQIR